MPQAAEEGRSTWTVLRGLLPRAPQRAQPTERPVCTTVKHLSTLTGKSNLRKECQPASREVGASHFVVLCKDPAFGELVFLLLCLFSPYYKWLALLSLQN